MEQFLNFCHANTELVFTIMVVLVVAITQLLKLPIKHFTKNMPEKKKNAINSTITAISVIMGFVTEAIYSALTGTVFNASIGGILGTLGAGSYNFYEFFRNIVNYIVDCRKKGKKVTADGIQEVAKKSKKNKELDKENVDNTNVLENITENFFNDMNNMQNNE